MIVFDSYKEIASGLDGGVATVLHVDHELVGTIGVECSGEESQG